MEIRYERIVKGIYQKRGRGSVYR